MTCLPSTTQKRAGSLSVFLILASEERVLLWLFGGARMRILTPRFLAFWSVFLRRSDLRVRPVWVVMMQTVCLAFLMLALR